MMLSTTARRALKALIPPPRRSLAEWIEAELRLPEGVSALPGRVHLWPYQRGIAEAISDPNVERVTLVKAVRCGFTTLLTGALGNYIVNEPSPILVLLPTESDSRDYIVSDVEPIFEATPVLKNALSADAEEASRNTLLSKRFPGGSLKVVAAKSPRNLRRHTARILLVDEADAMESASEGDVLTLAERRTLTYSNRKIIIGSTPIYESTSHVLRAYAQSDQRIFEVPCVECSEFNEITWKDIVWSPDQPETAAYLCPHCGSLIEERHKRAMVKAGRWRATTLQPSSNVHAGFRLNALVSVLANASWARLATEWLAAQGHPDKLQAFINTVLAQGYRETIDALDDSELASRVEPFGLDAIPLECLILTAGIDVQLDRLEVVILGHGRDDVFVLANMAIYGSPLDGDTWMELEELLKTTWKSPLGGTLRIDAAAIDASDGGTMDAVLAYCRPRLGRRIVAIKGVYGNRPAITQSKTKGTKLWIVGVDGVKSNLTARLARGRTVRFSKDLEPRYFEELSSEHLVVRYVRGAPTRQWTRIPGRRAEGLDATVYGIAVRGLVGVDLSRRAAELAEIVKPVSAPNVIRSKWLAGE